MSRALKSNYFTRCFQVKLTKNGGTFLNRKYGGNILIIWSETFVQGLLVADHLHMNNKFLWSSQKLVERLNDQPRKLCMKRRNNTPHWQSLLPREPFKRKNFITRFGVEISGKVFRNVWRKFMKLALHFS